MNTDLLPDLPPANRPNGSGSGEMGYAARGLRKLSGSGQGRALLLDRRGRRLTVVYGQAADHPTARLCVDFALHPGRFYRFRPRRPPRGKRRDQASRKQPAPRRIRTPRRWEPIVRIFPAPGGPLGLGRRAAARDGSLRPPGWFRDQAKNTKPAERRPSVPWELPRRNGNRPPRW
jgi:hypothetical protein